jgi:hypothetical protein
MFMCVKVCFFSVCERLRMMSVPLELWFRGGVICALARMGFESSVRSQVGFPSNI